MYVEARLPKEDSEGTRVAARSLPSEQRVEISFASVV